jgi:hypothetical protein
VVAGDIGVVGVPFVECGSLMGGGVGSVSASSKVHSGESIL